jgi:manganese/zinc/iron transport system permease protein
MLNLFTSNEIIQLLLIIFFSISLSIIGVFLFLKKKAMIANAVSHTVLFGVGLVYILMKNFSASEQFHLNSINVFVFLLVSIFTALFTVFCIECLKKFTKLQEHASIAFIFSTLFSLGVTLITISAHSSHVGIDVVMGNLDLVHINDLLLGVIVLCVVGVFVAIFFRDLVMLAFDQKILYFSNRRSSLLQLAFLSLVSFVITTGFRYVGIVPVLGLIILPVAAGSFYSKSVKSLLQFCIYSNVCISTASVIIVKFIYDVYGIGVSTSGMLVTIYFLFFLVLAGRQKKKVTA